MKVQRLDALIAIPALAFGVACGVFVFLEAVVGSVDLHTIGLVGLLNGLLQVAILNPVSRFTYRNIYLPQRNWFPKHWLGVGPLSYAGYRHQQLFIAAVCIIGSLGVIFLGDRIMDSG